MPVVGNLWRHRKREMICLLCYNELSGLCVHLYDSSTMQQTVLIIQWLSRATLARRLAELKNRNETVLGGKYRCSNTKQHCDYIFREHWHSTLSSNHTSAICSRLVLLRLIFSPIFPKDVLRSYFSSSRMFLSYFLGSVYKPEEIIYCTVWAISIPWNAKWSLWVFSISCYKALKVSRFEWFLLEIWVSPGGHCREHDKNQINVYE